MPDHNQNKHYIGDGAYAKFDGYGIAITTEDGISITNRVYLEPVVLQSLLKLAARYYKPALLIEAIQAGVPDDDDDIDAASRR